LKIGLDEVYYYVKMTSTSISLNTFKAGGTEVLKEVPGKFSKEVI